MITGKDKVKLNAETILSRVDDYNIIRHYLGQDFDFKKKFSSPFREKGSDNKPNLCFFMGNNERILFKDFADGHGGDCFEFVKKLFKIEYNEALIKIDEDFGLGIRNENPTFKIHITKKPDSIHKQSKLIQIEAKSFTIEELGYWNDYHISLPELIIKNVHSVNKLYINKQLLPNYEKTFRFAYVFDEFIKIYSPLSNAYKWISSCPNDFISGFDDIKAKVFTGTQDSKLIISKSVKDEIVLSKFFKDVCSTQNESKEAISNENMKYILKGYKPEDVYIAYDNDNPGVQASKYFTENYGFNYVNVPKIFRRENIKDWSDLVKHKGLDTMENYLKIKKLI